MIAGALSVSAFTTFLKSGIDLADGLSVVSLRTGITVENLSRLKFAAEQSETNFETLTAGLQRLSLKLAKAGIDGSQLEPVSVNAQKLQSSSQSQ